MTPPPETQSVDLTNIAVALGRIEEKVSHLGAMEERLRTLEQAVAKIQTTQRPQAPWYVVVGGLAGIGSLIITATAILTILNKFAEMMG